MRSVSALIKSPILLPFDIGYGFVYRANQSELQFLGYSREEYIGRSIVEFHADQAIIKGLFYFFLVVL